MHIVLSGASGLIGDALKTRLRADGHSLRLLVRREPTSAEEDRWDPAAGRLDPDVLTGADAVINLSGAGVGDHRWTSSYKQVLIDSRLQPTRLLATTMRDLGERAPGTLLSASAVGYYGDTGSTVVDEAGALGGGFLADLCRQWEDATAAARSVARVVHLRTGLVLSGAGGLLGRLTSIVDLGAGGRLGSGRQYQPWISMDDEVGAIAFLLTNEISGAVNLTGPDPVSQKTFIEELARLRHRPAVVPAPGIALRLVLGQFADEGVLIGQRAVPRALTDAGYEFTHPTLTGALSAALA